MTTSALTQPDLRDHWLELPLGDLLDAIEAGKNLRCEERPPKPSEKGVVKVSSVSWGCFDASQAKTLPKHFSPNPKSLIRAGDFLMSRANTIELVGACAIVYHAPANLYLSDKVLRLVLSDDLKLWVLRYLRSPFGRSQIEGASTGNQLSMRNISQGAIRRIKVPLPPDRLRRDLDQTLDGLLVRSSRARQELDAIPKLIAQYKQAILAKAFSGDLTEDWRESHPSVLPIQPIQDSAKKRRFADSAFQEPFAIPNSWRWLKLPSIGTLDRGRSKHRPRNDPRLFGGIYPFIQTGEVRAASRYLQSYTKCYSDFGLKQSRLWPIGTVCITIAANIAETAILGIEACFPDSIVGFSPHSLCSIPEYIEFFLRTMRADLERFAPATAQKNINLETLYAVHCPIPPLLEQHEIVRRLETAFAWLDKAEAEHSRSIHFLPKLDEAILVKAFRGELVPRDPNDEPASAPVSRVREQPENAIAPRRRRSRA